MKFRFLTIITILIFMMMKINPLCSQDSVYYPNGNPDRWNVQLNPYLWLPWINGELESNYLEKEFGVPVVDLLSNLRGAFMINAEVSKGKFFASPNYIYTKLGTEEVVKSGEYIDKSIVAKPEIKMNIAGLIIGMRNQMDEKFSLDPYVGVRYNSFKTEIEVDGIVDTTYVEEKADFWDPVIGLRTYYFPHPRVPIMCRLDVGGFGVGSSLSWTAVIMGGYTLSPQVDLIAGFSAYGVDFNNENKVGNTVSLKTIMYGFDLGVKILFPKRSRDPSLFKKKKK